MSVEFRAIRANELDECLDLWGTVFSVGRDFFPPYFYGDPWFRRAYTRVCAVDGKLVSVIQICERRVRVGESVLTMGGIGNVATLPEHRGRGYSQHLLNDCARVMNQHRIDFSVLFTGIQSFYEKALWRSVPQRMFSGNLRAVKTPDSPYSMRACDWTRDLPAISRVYDIFNRHRPLTTVRTPEYWDGYVRPRFGEPERTIVAEAGGKIVGYINFSLDIENRWLSEIGYLPEHKACADVLIRKAVTGAKKVLCNVPHEHEILAALNDVTDDLSSMELMSGMFRITHMKSLSEHMMSELNCRAKNCPDGMVSLDTELGSLRFAVGKGKVVLGAKNPIRVPVSQLEFFCLLFGIKDTAELGMSLPDGSAEIVNTLFPGRHPVFWGPDHF